MVRPVLGNGSFAELARRTTPMDATDSAKQRPHSQDDTLFQQSTVIVEIISPRGSRRALEVDAILWQR